MTAMSNSKRPDGWWYPWLFVAAFGVIIAVNGNLSATTPFTAKGPANLFHLLVLGMEDRMNRTQGFVAGAVVAVLVVAVAIWAFDVEITEEGRLPTANIDVDPGKLPKADVDTVDIDVGTKKKEVLLPDVEVTVEKETITIPTLDVTPPDAGTPGTDSESKAQQ